MLAGALLQNEVEGARLDEAIEDLTAGDNRAEHVFKKVEWAYRLGLCVGLRLQGVR